MTQGKVGARVQTTRKVGETYEERIRVKDIIQRYIYSYFERRAEESLFSFL